MPPPTQRCTRPSATASVLIVSASSKSPSGRRTPSAPIEAPRPTGSSEAIRSTAAIFGAPVTEPPGKVAARISPSRAPARSLPSTVRDEVRDAGELALGHQLGPEDRARLAHPREVVPLEVDDHHVLCAVLLALDVDAGGPGALDRHGHEPVAAAGEEELGRGRHDRPAAAGERLRVEWAQVAEGQRERGRIARERRREVLDEVHLVDVAAGDRRAHRPDRGGVALVVPAALPLPDLVAGRRDARGCSTGRTRQARTGSGHGSGGRQRGRGGSRPRARSRGRGRRRARSAPELSR